MIAAALLSLALGATPIGPDEVAAQSRDNAQAKLAALDAARATSQVTSARSAILPQVALRASASEIASGPQRIFTTVPKAGAGGIDFQNSVVEVPASYRSAFDLTFSVNQLVYDGGKWWSQLAQAGAQADAAEGQTEEQRLASELEGMRRFWELFRAQRTEAVLQSTVERSQAQVERARALFEAGRATQGDALSAEVNLGNDRIALVRQGGRIASAQADLSTWLARPTTEELVASNVPPYAPGTTPSVSDAVEEAHRQRPLLKALKRQIDAAKLNRDAARAGYRPRVSIQGLVGRQGPTVDPFFTDLTRQNYASAGLSMQWDLFNGYATDALVQQAELSQQTATLNFEQALRDLDAEVKKAVSTLSTSIAATDVAKGNADVAAKALNFAEERFKAGAASTLEVRDAQLKLTQAELSLLESQVDVQIARAALQRTLGASAAKATGEKR